MSEENYFSVRMTKMSDSELQDYLENKNDFQDEAILAAVLELEKRGISTKHSNEIKQKLSEKNNITDGNFEPINQQTVSSTTTPTLYSTQFIYIFGALFSVFGGGILMALNFIQLKRIDAAKIVVLTSLAYTFLLMFLFETLGVSNPFISLASSILGIFLLEKFIWKKEIPTEINYEKRAIWKPLLIGLAIAFPIAYLLIATGNFQL